MVFLSLRGNNIISGYSDAIKNLHLVFCGSGIVGDVELPGNEDGHLVAGKSYGVVGVGAVHHDLLHYFNTKFKGWAYKFITTS